MVGILGVGGRHTICLTAVTICLSACSDAAKRMFFRILSPNDSPCICGRNGGGEDSKLPYSGSFIQPKKPPYCCGNATGAGCA